MWSEPFSCENSDTNVFPLSFDNLKTIYPSLLSLGSINPYIFGLTILFLNSKLLDVTKSNLYSSA